MDYCVSKIRDKVRLYEKTDIISSTNFLTPAEVEQALPALRGKEFCLSGGFCEAERKIIIVGTTEDSIKDFCTCIRCTARKEITLSHRDVLGSVLGLGIKREMVGDIIVNKNVCDIIIMREMCEYILNNLNKIGREKVDIENISLNEVMSLETKAKDVIYSVASLRLDSVISGAFGISREKSSNLFKEEKVLLNFLLIKNDSKNVKEGDLISVRGFGRIKVLEVLGETKKGRIRISARIY